MSYILETIHLILNLYTRLLIISVVFSFLYNFRIINTSNSFVIFIGQFLYNATEPLLRPIRKILPNLGEIDISPAILLLITSYLSHIIR
ncbi:YggT family protein [Candidatus Liberibacter sp.]|uniref:YggT family protein n=1 Tax=Candidatus Liberibacter sp. TaxID=34022 RepID=UPI0015F6A960|nr:YggT family protein [Candidatus Liberibacter sp.]MBA5724234.1 YggT family protein [Candidatus Liberibacter sp.]